ncbi:MAG: heme lyase CcmF/NrfE family subunit [Gemmatimonadota bacterium]
MTRFLGTAAVSAAFLLAAAGLIAGMLGARRRSERLVGIARGAAYANFILLFSATAAMVYALVTHDFSVSYVAQVGSRSTPLFFTIISLWSSLEGSILFWALVLAGFTAVATYLTQTRLGPLADYATATMHGVQFFFLLLLIGPANPFQPVFPVPADGPGPNALLQNHILMAVHPPLLYLGYVGMTVPFAFAIGALLSGKLDDTWIHETRRWTTTAWVFLSLAIIMGMWWSYEVLGWGGYWAWDPVENASFMPWLTATAFLHSVMVQERRNLLRVWNLSLIIATFTLTILGTFLTRSGILSSVHAFSEGPIGIYFLAFIALLLIVSLVLLTGRSTELRSDGGIDKPVSRETVFLINNLLLTAFTFTVLLGTLFPLIAEAVRGVKVSVGAPFFNKMTVPLCAALLFLVGVGPALPWRGASAEYLKKKLLPPFAALIVGLVLAVTLGARSIYAILAFAFASFALASNTQEFIDGARARRRAHGEAFGTALVRLVRSNNRRYGGYIAHIGVIAIALGITASSEFKVEKQATLRPGETMQIEDFTIRFDRVWGREEPQRFVVGADLTVFKGDRQAGRMDPRMNFYTSRGNEPVPTPAVRERPNADLYISLMSFERNGSNVTLSVIVEPMVAFIWAGGFIVAFGALIGVLKPRPRAIRRERVEAEARAEAEAGAEAGVVGV